MSFPFVLVTSGRCQDSPSGRHEQRQIGLRSSSGGRAAPYNIGIATGPSELLVIDCDKPRGADLAEWLSWERTWRSQDACCQVPSRSAPQAEACICTSVPQIRPLAIRSASWAAILIPVVVVAMWLAQDQSAVASTTGSSIAVLLHICPSGLSRHWDPQITQSQPQRPYSGTKTAT